MLAWKGSWDLIEISFKSFAKYIYPEDDYELMGFIFSGVLGYIIFFYLFGVQKAFMKFKMRTRPTIFVEDIFSLLAYFGMVLIWQSFWSGYDHFITDSVYRDLIILLTHFLIVIIFCIFKISRCLNGPSSGSEGYDQKRESLMSFIRRVFRNNRVNDSSINREADITNDRKKFEELIIIEYLSSKKET